MVTIDHHHPPSPSPVPGTGVSVSFDDDDCLKVVGELEHETAPVFAGVIAGQIAHQRLDLRLDLSELTFFDLPGFDALCAAQRRLGECGGRLSIVRAGRLLRVVADLLGHGSLFEPAPVPLARPAGSGTTSEAPPMPDDARPRPRSAGPG